jgi:3-methyladenine DNA glycosylase AlkD
MSVINQVVSDIKKLLEQKKPKLSKDQKTRLYKIINPTFSSYMIFGVKTADLEKIARETQKKYNPSFHSAMEIFKLLARTSVEEYKFIAFFFLDRYKKQFTAEISQFFKSEFFPYCQTWSTCDSCCIRVLGPFLAKKDNLDLAKQTIDEWSYDDSLWVKRASMVLLLKIVMVHKDFDELYIFKKAEYMLNFSNENYIAKGIGWLLKTCSKYKPDIITEYLLINRKRLSRLILRYASEKLPQDKRQLIMEK